MSKSVQEILVDRTLSGEPDNSLGLKAEHEKARQGAYIAKWGAAEELSNEKAAHKGNRTPVQLLSDAADGDKQAAALCCGPSMPPRSKAASNWCGPTD